MSSRINNNNKNRRRNHKKKLTPYEPSAAELKQVWKQREITGMDDSLDKMNQLISDVIEKPSIKKAPSNYAIIGRYILPINIFDEIKRLKPSQGGEIHITDAIRNLILKGSNFFGNIFRGKYLDCGTINGYIQSSIQIFRGK